MNDVEFIDRWSPPQSHMNIVRSVGGANTVETVAGYTGAGVRAEVMDNGCQINHTDFTGRILVRGNTNFNEETHGTATFGIMFGSGAGSANARGMMPSAIGYFNDWFYPTSRYTDLAQLVTSPYNCVLQTNSWGFQSQLAYTNVSAEMDDAVFEGQERGRRGRYCPPEHRESGR
jgi:subtilisin family serine protease